MCSLRRLLPFSWQLGEFHGECPGLTSTCPSLPQLALSPGSPLLSSLSLRFFILGSIETRGPSGLWTLWSLAVLLKEPGIQSVSMMETYLLPFEHCQSTWSPQEGQARDREDKLSLWVPRVDHPHLLTELCPGALKPPPEVPWGAVKTASRDAGRSLPHAYSTFTIVPQGPYYPFCLAPGDFCLCPPH